MTWDTVDLDEGIWHQLGSTTKNAKPHAVPLPTTAVRILSERRAASPVDEPRVFPRLSMQSDGYRTLAAIHEGRYEWKDLRRSVATRLAGLGFSETTIGRTLNHARYTVTARHYNQHSYLNEIRSALEAWDRELSRIRRNAPRRGKVLPIGR
jgi:integrase